MIEWELPPLHQKLGFKEIGPASVVVECDLAAVAVRAEGFFQEFGRADSVTRIAALCGDEDFPVIRLGVARCEQDLAELGVPVDDSVLPLAGEPNAARTLLL